MKNDLKNILAEFNPSSEKEWKQYIQMHLKGLDYSTLLSQTLEGIDIKPFYHQDSFKKVAVPTSSQNFKIGALINVDAIEVACEHALKSITGGAETVRFLLKKPFDVSRLPNELFNGTTTLEFNHSFLDSDFTTQLSEKIKKQPALICIDPIGDACKSGNWNQTFEADLQQSKTLLQKLAPSQARLGIHACLYHNSGATLSQQIAYALAHANEYLNALGGEIAPQLQFHFAMGGNYFFEIAKLRAFKYLYQILLKKHDVECDATITAIPGLRNKSALAFNTNLIRTTTECLSAVLGGANTVFNIPYDATFKHSNEFSARIARNQLLILKHECAFNKPQQVVEDTYYIETITQQLAEKSLAIFKQLEENGGWVAQLKKGVIQRKILESAQKEQALFKEQKKIIVGVNKYTVSPLDELTLDKKLKPKKEHRKTSLIPLPIRRLALETEIAAFLD